MIAGGLTELRQEARLLRPPAAQIARPERGRVLLHTASLHRITLLLGNPSSGATTPPSVTVVLTHIAGLTASRALAILRHFSASATHNSSAEKARCCSS